MRMRFIAPPRVEVVQPSDSSSVQGNAGGTHLHEVDGVAGAGREVTDDGLVVEGGFGDALPPERRAVVGKLEEPPAVAEAPGVLRTGRGDLHDRGESVLQRGL